MAGVWVTSERVLGGTYQASVHIGDDHSFSLDHSEAIRYGAQLMAIAGEAVHDSAVLRQLRHIGMDAESSGQLVVGLRRERARKYERVSPLDFRPLVLGKTYTPMVGVVALSEKDGQPVEENFGAYEIDEARRHATDVMGAVFQVALDNEYAAFLATQADAEGDETAAHAGRVAMMIHELLVFREDAPAWQRLVRALEVAGAPDEMIDRAAAFEYDDYLSTSGADNMMRLVADCKAAGLDALADRVIAGEFDGSKVEAHEWAASPAGQAVIGEFFNLANAPAPRRGNARGDRPSTVYRPGQGKRKGKRKGR